MKIAVIGASGKAGRLIAKEAASRGFDVTAIVRNKEKFDLKGLHVLEKDVMALETSDICGFDAVINAFGSGNGPAEDHVTSVQRLISVFEAAPDVRFLMVGGAGSLYVDEVQSLRLIDTKDFPDLYKPVASNMAKGLELLRQSKVNWTYLSPSAFFDAEGAKTGSYKLGNEQLLVNASGNSYVSYGDFASAMVDELVNKAYVGKRFTVVSE